jgi:hypothetical protein
MGNDADAGDDIKNAGQDLHHRAAKRLGEAASDNLSDSTEDEQVAADQDAMAVRT